MDCHNCSAKFSILKSKRQCGDCGHYFCSGCIAKDRPSSNCMFPGFSKMCFNGQKRCRQCHTFSSPLNRQDLLKLKVKDLLNYLNSHNIPFHACAEKSDLVDLILATQIVSNPQQNTSSLNGTAGINQALSSDELPPTNSEPFMPYQDLLASQSNNSSSSGEFIAREHPFPTSNNNFRSSPSASNSPAVHPRKGSSGEDVLQTPSGQARVPMREDDVSSQPSYQDGRTQVPNNASSSSSSTTSTNQSTFPTPTQVPPPSNPLFGDASLECEDDGSGEAGELLQHLTVEHNGPSSSAQSTPSNSTVLSDAEYGESPKRGSPFAPHAKLSIDDLRSEEEIQQLSVRQLKEILTRGYVTYRGCCEKFELTQKVTMLWIENQVNKPENVDDITDDLLCKVCMSAAIDSVLLDCGHMATCTQCGKRLTECPICRQYVVRVVHTFRA